ncbi:MAG: multiprotein bridging factor aMBF1 [archaeon]|nr:TIGR00270 family protein [Candidatus Micrarchaeota archaeon]
MQCEVCGKLIARKNAFIISTDGVKMNVCDDCSSYGKVLHTPPKKPARIIKPSPNPFKRAESYEMELIDGIGEIIRKEREKRNLKIKELAEKIFEKESVVQRIESGKFTPTDEVIRKLEKFIGRSLREKKEDQVKDEGRDEAGAITLADFLKEKK